SNEETTGRVTLFLLAEAGSCPGRQAYPPPEKIDPGLATPETYLGAARAEGFLNGPLLPGRQDFRGGSEPVNVPPNGFFFRGEWLIDPESAESIENAALDFRFKASKVFLVMGAEDGPANVRVLLDGKPIPDELAGEDVSGAVAEVSGQRLYRLADLPAATDHVMTLEFDPGISGYAFTFG
ncbi:MAG: hypothetical protein ACR2OC_00025, partial [Solirubrobacterales bacterium]